MARTVALLAEGVDRNLSVVCGSSVTGQSPSSRRAWIEIFVTPSFSTSLLVVALLAEGVDRNELCPQRSKRNDRVALLAEGVDRNLH